MDGVNNAPSRKIVTNNKIFSTNLRRYMRLEDITPTQLAEELTKKNKIRVPATTVNDWVNGVKYPRIDNIDMLANFFGILKSDLIEDKGDTMIPVFKHFPPRRNMVSGATKVEEITEEDIYDYEPIPKAWLNTGNKYFVFIIAENSMSPMFEVGDYVIFEQTEKYNNGDCCIVLRKDGTGTFRRVSKDNDNVTLSPLNYKYNPESFKESDIHIVGVAKERRTKLAELNL